MKLGIIVPIWNEQGRIERLISDLEKQLTQFRMSAAFLNNPCREIFLILVDDGSEPAVNFTPCVRSGVFVGYLLRHPINIGQGAALQTGISYARDHLGCDIFITMDADGQHDPAHVPYLVNSLFTKNVDIIFGNRFCGTENAGDSPGAGRQFVLKAAALFESILVRRRFADAHHGFRVFNRKFANCLDLQQPRMAHATEFRQTLLKHRLLSAEIPLPIYYSKQTLAKGQKNIGGLMILKDLLHAFLFGHS